MIGAEFASVYTDLGVETTLLEAMNDGVLPIGPDRDVANVLAKSLAKRGTKIHAEARVGALQHTETGVIVPFETPKGSDKIEVDQVLVSIGRRPVTEGIGAEEAGVAIDERGFIEVDTEHHADLQAGRLRHRRLRRHPGAGARRLRRSRAWRSITSWARTRCRSTTARCRGSSTPTPRSPGPG